MMNIEYGVVKEFCLFKNNSLVSYGIAVCCFDDESGCFSILETVGNITTDRKRIAELVSLCNASELSPIHLREVIDDFLVQ